MGITESGFKRRYTFAFFIEGSSGFGGFQDIVWLNMVKAAAKCDVNLMVFAGGALDNAPYNPYEKNLNFIYDLVDKDFIDGIIINCTIKNYINGDQFKQFIDKFPIPMISIIGPIQGMTDVHVDNKNGMREVIIHLIDNHDHKNIAFIKGSEGNPDAEERFSVYKEVLSEKKLRYDPDLVYNGTFDEVSGVHAVNYFLKEKNKKIDAIVASNDAMAFGAVNELRRLNYRIPMDIAVTGFDDTDEAGAFNPSLTTVKQPFYDMGCEAIRELIEIVKGKRSVTSIAVPAKLVKRQSCGCFSAAIDQAIIKEDDIKSSASLQTHDIVADEIVKDLMILSLDKDTITSMFKMFVSDVENDANKFLTEMKILLQNSIIYGKDIVVWQHVISIIRKHTFNIWTDQKMLFNAENLINQSRVLVSEMSQQSQAYKKIINERQAKTLRDVGQSLITTFNFQHLKALLKVQIPKLDIRSYHISVFENIYEDTGKSRVFVQNTDEKSAKEIKDEYRKHKINADFLPRSRRFSFSIHPLFFKDFKLGFALFELGPEEGVVYDTMAVQISSALMGSELLFQRDNTESILKQRSDKIQELVLPMIESIKQVTEITKEKIDIIGNLINLTKENSEKLNSTNQSIEKMGEKFYKMLDIINVINDISVVVNVLAINTSIEAAHAGQYGKGFSIIAGEIRKLSDSIKHNTNEISLILNDIKLNIDGTKKAGSDSHEAFKRLEKDVIEVASTLQEIIRALNNLSDNSSKILSVMST